MIELALAPRASWRRHVLLDLLDQSHPAIEKLTAPAQQKARKRPQVIRRGTHPGVVTARSRTLCEVEHYPFDWVLIPFLASTELSSILADERWKHSCSPHAMPLAADEPIGRLGSVFLQVWRNDVRCSDRYSCVRGSTKVAIGQRAYLI
jgi:hypothetical protein